MTQRSTSGLAQLQMVFNAGQKPVALPYNAASPTYDQVTEDAQRSYIETRGALQGAANSSPASVQQDVYNFINQLDIAYQRCVSLDPSVQYTAANRPGVSLAAVDARVQTSIEAARSLTANAFAQASALVPKIRDGAYLGITAPAPGGGMATWAADTLESKKHDLLFGLSAGTDKQATAQRLVDLVGKPGVNLFGAYLLLSGPLDFALQAVGVDLVALHQYYANLLLSAGADVAGIQLVEAINQGMLEQASQACQTFCTRVIQLASSESAASRAQLGQ